MSHIVVAVLMFLLGYYFHIYRLQQFELQWYLKPPAWLVGKWKTGSWDVRESGERVHIQPNWEYIQYEGSNALSHILGKFSVHGAQLRLEPKYYSVKILKPGENEVRTLRIDEAKKEFYNEKGEVYTRLK